MIQTKKLPGWVVVALLITVFGCLFLYKTVLFPDGSITLAWTAPVEYENDDSMTDLAGYKIHCWSGASQYTNTIQVGDPVTTSFVIEELPSGTYNCAVSAINADGSVSALSNVVAKSIR